jgi:hypothetical protein
MSSSSRVVENWGKFQQPFLLTFKVKITEAQKSNFEFIPQRQDNQLFLVQNIITLAQATSHSILISCLGVKMGPGFCGPAP